MFVYRHFLEDLLHVRLVEEVHVHVLGTDVVDLIDLLLQLRQLALAVQHEHDLQAILLRGRQEDEALQIPDVLGVVGEVGVEFKVEVDVQVNGAQDGEAVRVPLLVDDQQSRAVLLPLLLVNMDEHLRPGHE